MEKAVVRLAADHDDRAGGGLPIPYREGQANMSISSSTSPLGCQPQAARQKLGHQLTPENRARSYLVAESGYL